MLSTKIMASRNFLPIMSMKEDDIERVVFEQGHKEGGINIIYEPTLDVMLYQVYVHCRLPFVSEETWTFSTFAEARQFAATFFDSTWNLLSWNFKTKRPCETEGRECGTGTCETCVSIKQDMEKNGEIKSSSGCGVATGQGSCGYA